MSKKYEPELIRKVVQLHLEEGRTYKSITDEYGIAKSTISKWCKEYSEECQKNSRLNPSAINEAEIMKENLRLRRELEEMKKENLFLKKAAAFFARETDQRLIGSFLAKRTLEKAIESQRTKIKGVLILHSDQGSQFTSKEFIEYCEKMKVTQSMSKAGYPYDNAPMERYFNTLKNDLIYNHSYKTEDELYRAIEEYAYVTYNHIRPHSYNGYKTPFEARYSA